jgi:hypothetical protein
LIATTVNEWCAANPESLDEVFLVGFDARVTEAFRTALAGSDDAGEG